MAAKNLQIEINPQYPRVAPGLLSWKAWQTLRSAAAEALEAFESGDEQAFCEELGDVMLQVVFHARIAAERDDGTSFTVDYVADGIVAKLARRHPHVFAGLTVSAADEVKRNWDDVKREEKEEKRAQAERRGLNVPVKLRQGYRRVLGPSEGRGVVVPGVGEGASDTRPRPAGRAWPAPPPRPTLQLRPASLGHRQNAHAIRHMP